MKSYLVLTIVAALAASCLSLCAHPSSGIAVDEQGRVFFAAGPMIVMIETNGVARTIVHDQKHERFYQLHHIQRAPDGGLLTASDMGNAIWRFTPKGELSRFYPPPNQDRPLSVGSGGDPGGSAVAVGDRERGDGPGGSDPADGIVIE